MSQNKLGSTVGYCLTFSGTPCIMCLWPPIYQPKLGQMGHVGGVLKTSGPADFKSVLVFDNWPRFVGVMEQNKISNSYENYCISKSMGRNLTLLWIGSDFEGGGSW